MSKICAVYKITNTVTNDFYIGSSKDVKHRWAYHKCHSSWNIQPNNPLYKDMKKYSLDKFEFQILAEVEPDKLKEVEQKFIEQYNPTYNNYNAKGLDIEKRKKSNKKYWKSNKCKENKKEYYRQNYENIKERCNKYDNQLCSYNGQTLTLHALVTRFRRQGLSNPTQEAKKYLL